MVDTDGATGIANDRAPEGSEASNVKPSPVPKPSREIEKLTLSEGRPPPRSRPA
jgi:hypothetical protein